MLGHVLDGELGAEGLLFTPSLVKALALGMRYMFDPSESPRRYVLFTCTYVTGESTACRYQV